MMQPHDGRSAVTTMSEGSWLEAIGLFQQARVGDYPGGMYLLESSADPGTAVHGLLRLLGVYLRGEDPEKLDGFLDVSYRVGPPPLLVESRPTEITADMRQLIAAHPAWVSVREPSGAVDAFVETSLAARGGTTLTCEERLPAGTEVVVTVLGEAPADGYRFIGRVPGSGPSPATTIELAGVHRLRHDRWV